MQDFWYNVTHAGVEIAPQKGLPPPSTSNKLSILCLETQKICTIKVGRLWDSGHAWPQLWKPALRSYVVWMELYQEMKRFELLVLGHFIHFQEFYLPAPPLDRVITLIPPWRLFSDIIDTAIDWRTLMHFEVFWTFIEKCFFDRSRLPVWLSLPYQWMVKIWRANLPCNLIQTDVKLRFFDSSTGCSSMFTLANDFFTTHPHVARYIYLRHKRVTRKMTMIVSNVSVGYTFFRERNNGRSYVAKSATDPSIISLSEEGVTHRNVGDYHCHLSRHPFVSQINILCLLCS